MLGTARGTQALIDLEDRCPDVLFERLAQSPVPLWPQLRTLFFVALNELDYAISTVPKPEVARANAWASLARSMFPAARDVRRARGRTPFSFLVSGKTVRAEKGESHNWLVGDFVQVLSSQAKVVQWAPLPSRYGPPAFPETWSLDPLLTQAPVRARLARRDPEPGIRAIVNEAVRHLDAPLREDQVASIVESAVSLERVRPYVDDAYSRVLDRLDPSIVVMEDASYGAWASLVAMMHDREITVAEPQHGWIGPTHAAYNFGQAMHQEPLRATLPDELLTFGNYWSRGLRFPGRVTVIGKPHLEVATKRLLPVGDRTEVLVASSTADPDEMSSFVLELRSSLDPNWTVVFRPHPSERPVVAERYPQLVSTQGIRIDTRSDVYESLGAAAAVIGVASTVLFEALAFGCRVYVRDSPLANFYVGDMFGPRVSSNSDLAKVVEGINRGETHDGQAHLSTEDLWAPGARNNFQMWAESALQQ